VIHVPSSSRDLSSRSSRSKSRVQSSATNLLLAALSCAHVSCIHLISLPVLVMPVMAVIQADEGSAENDSMATVNNLSDRAWACIANVYVVGTMEGLLCSGVFAVGWWCSLDEIRCTASM
jgi:hypothetical protein